MLIVIVSGLLLQVKKQVAWVQPPTQSGIQKNVAPIQDWETVLSTVRGIPDANVDSWSDIDRFDVRFSKGTIKVITKSNWEIQIDSENGQLLSSSIRRSDWIEQLHDGSFFGEYAKLWLFLPNGLVLLMLWISGLWLWYLPVQVRRSKRVRAKTEANNP
jgi:uncharacterized iron-regulated membrane protein